MFKSSYKAGYVPVILKAKAWKRAPMKLLKWGRKMPSKQQYSLVDNDDYDIKIPVHPEEAFHHGIPFAAKYIGSMEVPRPSNRVEIVAAMRRVRLEFKANCVKKRKVIMEVSIDGVRVTAVKKKKKRFFSRSKNRKKAELKPQVIMHHPIYRIFYVSHDSSDLKIFSYIARDGATNEFKCNVFKSTKKSQAMRIVRTVGQAFEVCHNMQRQEREAAEAAEAASVSARGDPVSARGDHVSARGDHVSARGDPAPSNTGSDILPFKESGASSLLAQAEAAAAVETKPPPEFELLPPPARKANPRRPAQSSAAGVSLSLPECVTKVEVCDTSGDASTPLTAQHQMQLLRERLDQQAQQTRVAVAQLILLRDQLAAEQAARCEAQARTHQLLVHNKELLEHISALVAHLQERDTTRRVDAHQLTLLPQLSSSAKIDRWFSLLPGSMAALSRPESGFVSGVEDADAATLAEARNLLLQLSTKKKRRLIPIRFSRRKTIANKHTLL
ncbi:carboxyl-terminal PDZ ligand of neuronal nitric oxide synthase protein isoform X3 [Plutella xylostella]|uniref:carboxyl-terminal PDZ ligand of neuronal nitric oxide synthase protein isoform X3 n=1 Tax=Plutella xylostella TaxID=51655 RepID=UPI002032FA53|nr:carboxyl-terminal PDZ ligand of neuronal nitric oxide synthase protein isoform X3 [Plutella xylostella]